MIEYEMDIYIKGTHVFNIQTEENCKARNFAVAFGFKDDIEDGCIASTLSSEDLPVEHRAEMVRRLVREGYELKKSKATIMREKRVTKWYNGEIE